MIPKECKRLAEVDFPIAVVSKHSAREKAIRHGHPSTLHLWWARRPLAACRSMLMALLLPDPCDPYCPADFKNKARDIFKQSRLAGKKPTTDEELRAQLLHFIGDFADWDNSGHSAYLEVARALVKAAQPEETPLVVDPFAGGGSIPLEALRLGCDAFASDLNPVACLINKVLLEDIPRHGPELAEELRRVGAEVKKTAEKELAEFYPRDPDGARPIAYLWARTVRCEAPNCGAEIPLMRSFWLCKKAERRRGLRTKVNRPTKGVPHVEFEIFTPTTEKDVRGGTVSRAKATCLCCNTVLHPERVRSQLAAQHGGANVVFDAKGNRIGGATLLVVVTLRDGESGRHYRLPTDADYKAVWKAQQRLNSGSSRKRSDNLTTIPEEEIPLTELRRISVPIYGMSKFRHMYTSRQLVCLSELSGLVARLAEDTTSRPCARLLAMSIDKTADLNNANTPWKPDAECPVHTLARHDIGMAWDYAEAAPLGESSGSFFSAYERTADSVAPSWCHSTHTATTQAGDACNHSLPDDAASIWFTDPPYYDSIPYAHLSDFFYVWMKRALPQSATADSTLLCPKNEECVVDRPHSRIPEAKTAEMFESRIAQAMCEGARVTSDAGIACVVFAHKTTDGWEALLSGMIRGGWTITGSWPIATEMATRLNARDNASLSASVHLVCRPRPKDAPIGDWGQVLRELPKRVADWMTRLQEEGVRGADLVFACIGPALEVFSRYSKVVDAEEREIPLGGDPEAREAHKRGFLAYVWEVVGRTALEEVLGTAEAKARNGAAGALEEDARLTALFLWTLQATTQEIEPASAGDDDAQDAEANEEDGDGAPTNNKKKKGLTLPFDVARRFAQPLGIHLDAWEGRCFHPATLSVFQRKWQTLPQFQQTRGTLAMLAQWISKAVEDGYKRARREPLITLGSAPLDVPEFRSVVLGQLGESRLLAAIDTDIASERSHARTLDADTTGALRDIHRRVGATILFESSGGQVHKVAHLPELRFALGEPEVDTTSVDTAAGALEAKAFFIQRVGADGFKVYHKAKIDKAVHDRRASLDEEDEVKPTIRTLVKEEIKRGASIPVEPFPADSSTVPDSPRLNLVVLDPNCEWDGGDAIRTQIAEWTKNRGKSSRLYPGALVWCVRKPGRDLRDKVELLLAWRRVQKDVRDGVLGADFERADLQEIQAKVAEAEEDAKDEVWAGYRFVVLADSTDPSGLKVIDLGAGHSSGSETLCGRIIAALKAEALLNESVGAGYIDRNWPPAFKESGAWPLASLRQSFLNGALTRLLDPDGVLKTKLVEFVGRGDFGLASGPKPEGGYERLWAPGSAVPADEIAFESGVVLLKKSKAEELQKKPVPPPDDRTPPQPQPDDTVPPPADDKVPPPPPPATARTIKLSGSVPAELWNRLGTRVLPKLKTGKDLKIGIEFSVTVEAANANDLQVELKQILTDLGLQDSVGLEQT